MKMAIYSKNIPNTDIDVYLRENSSDEDLFRVLIDEDEYGYISLTHKPSVIIDAGANIGLSSIYFMMKYPSAQIYAIEPEIENYNLLVKNVANYRNIIPINAALSPQSGKGKVIDTGQGDLAYQISIDNDCLQDRIIGETLCFNIESFCANYKIEVIDLLKIDIEGMEKKIFESDCSWLANVNVLIIELHERFYPGCNYTVFSAVKNYFDLEWIGGENYIFAKKDFAKPMIPKCFKTKSPQQLPIEQVWDLQQKIQMNKDESAKMLEPIYKRIDNIERLFAIIEDLQHAVIEQRTDHLNYMKQLQHAIEEIQSDRTQRAADQQIAFGQLQHAIEEIQVDRVQQSDSLAHNFSQIRESIESVQAERAKQISSYDTSLCELQTEMKALKIDSEAKISYMENCVSELQEDMEAFKQSIWYRLYKKFRGGRK